MTGTKIHAEERSVGDIFTDNYRFSIPRYQRPYAWTTEQAGEMLDDLAQAAHCEHDLKSSDPYFLGSVVLVKADGDARAEVVDGQQRLTTLIILLSVLREFVPAGYVVALDRRIYQEGDPSAARLLGAGTVIAAGRDADRLAELRALGADRTVTLGPDDLAGAVWAAGGVDVIVDYVWGQPAATALTAGKPGVRLVHVGDRRLVERPIDARELPTMPLGTGPPLSLAVLAGARPRRTASATRHVVNRRCRDGRPVTVCRSEADQRVLAHPVPRDQGRPARSSSSRSARLARCVVRSAARWSPKS